MHVKLRCCLAVLYTLTGYVYTFPGLVVVYGSQIVAILQIPFLGELDEFVVPQFFCYLFVFQILQYNAIDIQVLPSGLFRTCLQIYTVEVR